MASPKGHVARIVSDLPYGGVERRLLSLLPKLRDMGWDVSVFCIRTAGEMAPLFEREGISVEVVPFKSRWSPTCLFRLAKRLKEKRSDIVHTHMYRCNTSGVVAARLARTPVVIANVHNVNEWDDFRQLLTDRLLARLKDKIVAVSEGVRQDYLRQTHISPSRVVTIYNGIDVQQFQGAEAAPEMASRFGVGPGDKVVATAARLVEQKRHTDFLQMAALVSRQLPQTRFLIVGKGKLREQLEQEARDMGISEHVCFAGHVNDIPGLLALTDVIVMCSDKEGFSNALLEAMAAGVPVVATDVGGNAEAIVDGESGYIVPRRRPDLIAEKVISLLTDGSLHERISRGAEARSSVFSIDRMCAATDSLYTELLSRAGRTR